MTTGLTSLLWFIAIIAMIPIALWLLKRTPIGGASAHQLMRSIAVLPISPSQRLVTVEVGSGSERHWLVLGVTAQTITTLHTMAPQDDAIAPPATHAPMLPFAQLLSKLRQAKGSAQ
jgi:flagellar protein FliO/FliZ